MLEKLTMWDADLTETVGKTIASIIINAATSFGNYDEVSFVFTDGSQLHLYVSSLDTLTFVPGQTNGS